MKKIYFTFILLLTYIANAQNPLLLKEVVSNTNSNTINEIVATKSGVTFFNTVANNPDDYSDLWGLWRSMADSQTHYA